MPYINLMVAQGVAAWIASPFLVGSVLEYGGEGAGSYFYYFVAAVGALIIWIGGQIGARVTNAIRRPTLLTLAVTLVLALAGAFFAAAAFAPRAEESRAMAELFVLTPVATALLGYFLARGATS
jgi:uncharacterized membrane protein YfcA